MKKIKRTLTVQDNTTGEWAEMSTSEGDGRTQIVVRVTFEDGTYMVLDPKEAAAQFTPVR